MHFEIFIDTINDHNKSTHSHPLKKIEQRRLSTFQTIYSLLTMVTAYILTLPSNVTAAGN